MFAVRSATRANSPTPARAALVLTFPFSRQYSIDRPAPIPRRGGGWVDRGDPGMGAVNLVRRERSSHKHRPHVPGRTSRLSASRRPGSTPAAVSRGRSPDPDTDPVRRRSVTRGQSPRDEFADARTRRDPRATPSSPPHRPQRFEDVVGQDTSVQSLRNAIRLNRVTHAYLFAGTRGVGKTSIARSSPMPQLRARADLGAVQPVRHLQAISTATTVDGDRDRRRQQ